MAVIGNENAGLDESADRFQLMCKRLCEYDDAWYLMRASENRILFADSSSKVSRKPREEEERRYFECFYESFKGYGNRYYDSLLRDILEAENSERSRVVDCQMHEFRAICTCASVSLGIPSLARIYFASLHPLEGEEVERRVIESDCFQMFIEATVLLECLHRRNIVLTYEPDAREAIQSNEAKSWIQAHKKQVDRETEEERLKAEREKTYEVAFHAWRQQQDYQVFLFAHTEYEERLDVEKMQRFYIGEIAKLYYSELKQARYHQLKHELSQRALPADLCRCVISEEVMARSNLMLAQRDGFITLMGEESKSFHRTRRHILMNDVMSRERSGGLENV
ncbi:hypothetical protein ERJ75_000946000 [Trypanosoma vivax]|uniref:Uncharacterized protein n=1 Tax=Trypanosoma vivax (strain Y486) TaxID=1055687 RepID=G0U4F9_TRYVY|nr:hypothetical protein TRVL_05533 [Trypanosoma vivax]KAH8611951.1 hypothetical protein ERJ75_000946000 [Trypanosoma vivax]CCC52323.1 conserved hypothetical protein [Trypanosoma vivax Y486]